MTIYQVPYGTKREYIAEMSQPYFYGTSCELMVAAKEFPFKFELFHGGKLLACYGEHVEEVKRLKFYGNFMGGHFDVLIPCEQATNFDEYLQNVATPSTCIMTPTVVLKCFENEKQNFPTNLAHDMTNTEVQDHQKEPTEPKTKRVKRQGRFLNTPRRKQLLEAV